MTTTQYLRFTPSCTFGVIGSSTSKILCLDFDSKCNSVVVPACENVYIWNLQTKEKSLILQGESSYVTAIMYDENYRNIAVGYANGFIRIFDIKSGTCIVSFCGHKTAVSSLAFDKSCLNLASGGKDCEIVVWNITDQAGLFRLKGHKGPISKCQFFKERNILVSGSKDTLIKFWDLDTQHCFHTISGMFEVLDFVIIKDIKIIAAQNCEQLSVWNLIFQEDETSDEIFKKRRLDVPDNENEFGDKNLNNKAVEENDDSDEKFRCVEGRKLSTSELTINTSGLVIDKTERLLACHASAKVIQLYKILTPEESQKLLKRMEKNKERRNNASDIPEMEVIEDGFDSLRSICVKGFINSISVSVLKDNMAKISVLLKNNSILQYELNISNKDNTATICHSIALPGHRGIIRSLNYSSDSLSILSLSDESVKIWKRFQEEQVCIQTLDSDGGLCSIFISGGTHCVIGTKFGKLLVFNINSQQMLEKIDAHDRPINCICESPDQIGVTSGGKDKNIKFWDYALLSDENSSTTKKRLSLTLKRTLQMPEEIICLRYSPDKRKLAIALLDNTVQVVFVDSLKLIFSLYGHVLPVTCMDMSHDSTLIATGSEDKDIRIWSMEFGSCNKFIKKAHDKGITCLYFLPRTHMFFTGGRDYMIKQWDADNFQKITTLKGHQNEVLAMAVSPDGVTVATTSKDRSIRIWEKTEEPLILEEEQEMEQEKEEEKNAVGNLPIVPGEVNQEVALPAIKTIETIKNVEQLIESIDVYKSEVIKQQEHEAECEKEGKELPVPTRHPLFIAYSVTSPIRYMQKVVNRIKSSELEGTLLYLPLNYVLDFLKILCEFVDRGWEPEFCERCSSFLVRIHMGQMISDTFQPVVERLKEKLFTQIYQTRDRIGFAKTACQLQQRAIDAVEEVPMFTSILNELKQKGKKKGKRKRTIITFK